MHRTSFQYLVHNIGLFSVLFGIWYVFSGHTEPFFLVSGGIACLLALGVAHRMEVVDHEAPPLHLTWKAPVYWLWLLKEMWVSALGVCRHVWAPGASRFTPALAWIPVDQPDDVGRTIYANSITLTPGTTCINMEADRAEVHALETASIDDLVAGRMQKRVHALMGHTTGASVSGKKEEAS